MQTVSETYNALWGAHAMRETRIYIAGNLVDSSHIMSMKRSSGMFFDTLSIGNAASSELTLNLWNYNDIPYQAEIRVEERLTDGETSSEWLAGGRYWVDTRAIDGYLTALTCYDAMMKAETTFFTTGDWLDMTMQAAVSEILGRMGVQLDSRTVISSTHKVTYPNDMTMREVLAAIAAAHGGNFIITPAGKLRLVRLVDIPQETNYIVNGQGDALTLGGMRLKSR